MSFRLIILTLVLFYSCSVDDSEPNKRNAPKGYTLVWNDEFDASMIDESNWNYETGDGTNYGLPPGWGNEEEQIYTKDFANASVGKDGERTVLTIRAIKTGANNYTSAKLTTQDKMTMRFGRVDVKAKMPVGKGLWSAIWTLGANRSNEEVSWPGCGEIDLVEVLGNQPAEAFSTLHFTNKKNKHEYISNKFNLTEGDFSSDYHLYSLEWTPEDVKYFIDNELFATVPIREDMKEFLRPHYLILNVAVGGTLGGEIDSDFSSSEMLVDYVRVYEKDGFSTPEEPAFVSDEEVVGKVIDQSVVSEFVKENFNGFGAVRLTAYGPMAPDFLVSDTALDGSSSVAWVFPKEGDWGGAYILCENEIDINNATNLHFAINASETLTDAEIKLEGANSDFSVFLKDYTGVQADNGFTRYSIPIVDFLDLDKSVVTIPFSFWNVVSEEEEKVRILLDEVYFE